MNSKYNLKNTPFLQDLMYNLQNLMLTKMLKQSNVIYVNTGFT